MPPKNARVTKGNAAKKEQIAEKVKCTSRNRHSIGAFRYGDILLSSLTTLFSSSTIYVWKEKFDCKPQKLFCMTTSIYRATLFNLACTSVCHRLNNFTPCTNVQLIMTTVMMFEAKSSYYLGLSNTLGSKNLWDFWFTDHNVNDEDDKGHNSF